MLETPDRPNKTVPTWLGNCGVNDFALSCLVAWSSWARGRSVPRRRNSAHAHERRAKTFFTAALQQLSDGQFWKMRLSHKPPLKTVIAPPRNTVLRGCASAPLNIFSHASLGLQSLARPLSLATRSLEPLGPSSLRDPQVADIVNSTMQQPCSKHDCSIMHYSEIDNDNQLQPNSNALKRKGNSGPRQA